MHTCRNNAVHLHDLLLVVPLRELICDGVTRSRMHEHETVDRAGKRQYYSQKS